jgi:hypothetical protein
MGLVGLGGCARFGPGAASDSPTPAPTPIVTTDSSIQVITGQQDNQIVTERLRLVRQVEGNGDARVEVTFTHPKLLGYEGAVQFLQASDVAKVVVLDAVIADEGGTVRMTPGTYRLVAYYRSCDANCGYLDPPRTFCEADATLAPNGRYRLTVNMTASRCSLE